MLTPSMACNVQCHVGVRNGDGWDIGKRGGWQRRGELNGKLENLAVTPLSPALGAEPVLCWEGKSKSFLGSPLPQLVM